jgi:hypothetical protein
MELAVRAPALRFQRDSYLYTQKFQGVAPRLAPTCSLGVTFCGAALPPGRARTDAGVTISADCLLPANSGCGAWRLMGTYPGQWRSDT